MTLFLSRLNLNECLAESMGTFFLVLFGCGAMVIDFHEGVIGHGGVAAAFGLIVMVMIYSVGNISGAHLNPAVTIAFMLARNFPVIKVGPYIAAQILGAFCATVLLHLAFGEESGLGVTVLELPTLAGFVCEFLLSFLLMFVILNVSTGHHEKGIMAGAAIGATVCLEALVGGPLTGASMNPARSIGPAVATGQYEHLWLYIVAPILGALAAAPFCAWVQGQDCCSTEEPAFFHRDNV